MYLRPIVNLLAWKWGSFLNWFLRTAGTTDLCLPPAPSTVWGLLDSQSMFVKWTEELVTTASEMAHEGSGQTSPKAKRGEGYVRDCPGDGEDFREGWRFSMWHAKTYVITGITWIPGIYLVLYITGHSIISFDLHNKPREATGQWPLSPFLQIRKTAAPGEQETPQGLLGVSSRSRSQILAMWLQDQCPSSTLHHLLPSTSEVLSLI